MVTSSATLEQMGVSLLFVDAPTLPSRDMHANLGAAEHCFTRLDRPQNLRNVLDHEANVEGIGALGYRDDPDLRSTSGSLLRNVNAVAAGRARFSALQVLSATDFRAIGRTNRHAVYLTTSRRCPVAGEIWVQEAFAAGGVDVVRDEDPTVTVCDRIGDGWRVRCLNSTKLVRGERMRTRTRTPEVLHEDFYAGDPSSPL